MYTLAHSWTFESRRNRVEPSEARKVHQTLSLVEPRVLFSTLRVPPPSTVRPCSLLHSHLKRMVTFRRVRSPPDVTVTFPSIKTKSSSMTVTSETVQLPMPKVGGSVWPCESGATSAMMTTTVISPSETVRMVLKVPVIAHHPTGTFP